MESNILIWNKEIGFIRIAEGNGTNLLSEDEDKGFVDYIMLDILEYDGYDFEEVDGAQVMLTELYQEKFNSKEDVVRHLINTNWIPEANYTYLYAE